MSTTVFIFTPLTKTVFTRTVNLIVFTMHTEPYLVHLLHNRIRYLMGQLVTLEIYLLEERDNPKVLHLMQTYNGGSVKMFDNFKDILCEVIFTLTNTLIDAENTDARTRSIARIIRKAALTIPVSKRPLVIEFLKELIKKQSCKSIK